MALGRETTKNICLKIRIILGNIYGDLKTTLEEIS